MATKSFFRNLLNFITNSDTKAKSDNLSVQQALVIQKDYVHDLDENKSDILSPPYTEIAKQLNGKPEIFRAAMYYLMKIAKNESKYAVPILSILKHFSKSNKLAEDDLEFLNSQIDELENSIIN